jgi:hypothetical protein
MPWDWSSFLSGAAITAAASAFGTGFAKKAGEASWDALRKRIYKAPLPNIEIDRHFDPVLFRGGDCAWVPELRVEEFEDRDYTHYPHPSGAPRCFRLTSDGRQMVKEFLMVSPDAEGRPINR